MRAAPLLLLIALPSLALAGCLDGEDAGAEERPEVTRAAPTVTPSLGAVRGIVTDTAVRPVVGATITLLEANLTARTLDDGSFQIGSVKPGSYTVTVAADGFVPAAESVTVRADEVALLDFVLAALISELPYTQQLELGGFMACGFAGGYNLSVVPEPPEPVPDARGGSLAWTVCEDVEFLAGNTTNDRTYWTWALDPPLHTFVYEIVWDDQGNELIREMTSRINIADWGREITQGPYTVLDVQGESPLLARIDRDGLDALQANFSTRCGEGDDAYCGHSFYDNGWPMAGAVLPFWRCLNESASVCAAAEQRFTVYVSGFFHAPAPPDWSVAAGA